ncbi:hypothetical protein LLH06_07735 [Mucilaginibacter daejeonensis]|uniref:hypothetical protein n=1 Tax=Mucilaginibacter daejeonensis TaxID=398049 RepID=UPI001D1787D5|nr:hypothetical protein [Mucilaginibacter daejeonensis]UEG54853.1 hypothetical protein LLH06_07735 [Mucilaginibacter daejeonensis]
MSTVTAAMMTASCTMIFRVALYIAAFPVSNAMERSISKPTGYSQGYDKIEFIKLYILSIHFYSSSV